MHSIEHALQKAHEYRVPGRIQARAFFMAHVDNIITAVSSDAECSLLQVLHKMWEAFLELVLFDSLMSIARDKVVAMSNRSSLLAQAAAVFGSFAGQPTAPVMMLGAEVPAGLAVVATVGEARVRQACAKERPLARLL